ncbi:MAG: hypothetical protein JWP89_2560 [Schlesneria sp.]|nr:hypothetical protein [Schlesneria sp.]
MTGSPDSSHGRGSSVSLSHQASDGTLLSPGNVPRRMSDAAPMNGVVSVVSPVELEQTLSAASAAKPHGAYELKFLIDEDRASRIMEWARTHLHADPHAGGAHGDGYHVNSLYLDTPNMDVFHRSELYQRRKYRLRRYGTDSQVWLEVKQKRKGLVRKQRISIDDSHIEHRATGAIDPEWDGAWFRQRLDEHALRPVCQMTYRRFARIGTTINGTMRLTIDDGLTGCLANGWQVPDRPLEGISLLQNQRILELKFQVVMPVIFRQLVEQEQLLTTSFSKYRTGVEECVPLDWIAGEW